MGLVIVDEPTEESGIGIDTSQQVLLALHIVVAIRPVLACGEDRIAEEADGVVGVDEELHRKIKHLILIKSLHHEAALRGEEALQSCVGAFPAPIPHKHAPPRR